MREDKQDLTKANMFFIAIFALSGALCMLKSMDSEFDLYNWNFSWWWCFIPVWGSVAIMMSILIIGWFFHLMIAIEMVWKRKKRERKFKK